MLGYTIFESNTLGDDSTYTVSNTTWIAQSFTPSTAHDLFAMAFKVINAASCGDMTIRIFAVDGSGKPTGSALATFTVDNADISTTAAAWEAGESSALRVEGQLIAVVSAAATGLGVRYQSVGLYTAGKAWYSTNSGSTWTEISGGSFLFQDLGKEIPLYGTYDVVLYPSGEGTLNQLYNEWSTYKPNYSLVNDPIDAVDHLVGVEYSLRNDTAFMSGESDSVAGVLTGTTLLWKTGTAGIAGDGTDFTSELAEGYYVKSPTECEWYRGKSRPISEIKSIESGTAATLTYMPGDQQGASSNRWDFDSAWFFTPSNTADADAGKISARPEASIPELTLPATYMPGVWAFTTGSDTVTATGGSASSLYPDAAWPMQYIGTGGSATVGTGGAWPILSVDSDNQVTLWSDYGSGSAPGIVRIMLDGKCKYCYWGWIDDLTDADLATMWTTPTKIDTYALKTSLNTGTIYQMRIRFSAYVSGYTPAVYPKDIKSYVTYIEKNIAWITLYTAYLTSVLGSLKTSLVALGVSYPTLDFTIATGQIDTTLALIGVGTYAELVTATRQVLADVSHVMQEYLAVTGVKSTATARPLFYMSGTYSYGTSRTITGTNTNMSTPEMIADAVIEYDEVISRPGGGAFTVDDLSTLEIGIQLGNLSNERQPMKVVCTQLCAIAKVSNLPGYLVTQVRVGLDDLGFIAFADGWDEFNQYVGIDGVNTMGWKVHYTNWFGVYILRPLRIMREYGIKIVRPISRVLAIRRR